MATAGLSEWVRIDKGVIYAGFPSTEELFRRCDSTDGVSGAEAASHRADSDGWYGNMDYDTTLRAATLGWTKGADLVREKAEKIRLGNAKYIGEQRRIKRGVVGLRVDLAAFNQRRPDHMVRKVKVRTNDGSVVRIAADCGALGYVSGEAMATRSVAIATVINAIEKMGIACEVVALHSAHVGSSRDQVAVVSHVAKKAAFPLNLERMAFAMGHPGVHRRGAFGVRERCPKEVYGGGAWGSYFSGYGSTTTCPEKLVKMLGIDYHIPDYSRDSVRWDSASDEDVAKWCIDTYNKVFAAKLKKGA